MRIIFFYSVQKGMRTCNSIGKSANQYVQYMQKHTSPAAQKKINIDRITVLKSSTRDTDIPCAACVHNNTTKKNTRDISAVYVHTNIPRVFRPLNLRRMYTRLIYDL